MHIILNTLLISLSILLFYRFFIMGFVFRYPDDHFEKDDVFEFVDDYGDYVLLRNKETGEEIFKQKEE